MQATNIIITSDHVDITLNNSVERGDTLNTQYIPGTNKVQDLSGNEAAPFTLPVTIELWPDGSCTDLLLTVIDANTIQADWINGSTDETGIITEISTDQVTWTPFTLAAGTLTKIFTGLVASTLYYVRVRAVKNGYYSDYTSVASATTDELAILLDGNTIAWYDFLEGVTKDGSDFVSRWNDKLLSGRDLIQATGTNQPKWYASDGVLFDGINDFLKTAAFTYAQPITIYLVAKQISWTSGDKFFDGNGNDNMSLSQSSYGKAFLQPYAGALTTLTRTPHSEVGAFDIIRIRFNGAASDIKINNTTTPLTGNFGTNSLTGITLCKTGGLNLAFGNIQFKEIIYRSILESGTDYDAIYTYLLNKYFSPVITPVWTPQGTVMNGTIGYEGSENIFEPNIIYEGNPQILTGETNVFKMWYTGGWSSMGIYYAESTDGLTWTKLSTGVIIANYRCSHVFKLVDTYYLYAPNTALTQFDLYTSSDGITFTLDTAAVLVKDAGSGWDNGAIANIHVIIEAGIWYMFYEAYKTTGGLSWQIGLATSNDGRVWAKQTSPIMPTSMSRGGPNVHKIGSVFYMWCHGFSNGIPALPTDLFRYKSTDLLTWVRDVRDLAYHRVGADEGATSEYGQVADIFILEVNSQCYMFHSATANGNLETGHLHIKLAIADMTLAELVTTQEGRIV